MHLDTHAYPESHKNKPLKLILVMGEEAVLEVGQISREMGPDTLGNLSDAVSRKFLSATTHTHTNPLPPPYPLAYPYATNFQKKTK